MASRSPIEGISKVVVHPLVMLSVTDHYNRVAKGTKKRVVGMLLGHSHKGRVDVVNSFAVPFAEDPTDPRVWFLDHFYLDRMYAMFRKVTSEPMVNAGERREAAPPAVRVFDIEAAPRSQSRRS